MVRPWISQTDACTGSYVPLAIAPAQTLLHAIHQQCVSRCGFRQWFDAFPLHARGRHAEEEVRRVRSSVPFSNSIT